MRYASLLIKTWAKNHGTRRFPNRWQISKTKLSLKSHKYVHFTGKAWQTGLIMEYLDWFLQTHDLPELDADIKTCVWAGNNIAGLIACSDMMFSEDQVKQLSTVGNLFLTTYLRLHEKFRSFCCYRLWNPRPKLHLITHVVEQGCRRKNPRTTWCFMDEDWIKSIMRLAKKTHSCSALALVFSFSQVRKCCVGAENHSLVQVKTSVATRKARKVAKTLANLKGRCISKPSQHQT